MNDFISVAAQRHSVRQTVGCRRDEAQIARLYPTTAQEVFPVSENYPSTAKSSALDVMMKEVANCRKCTSAEGGIEEDKRLINLIAGRPKAPWYGEIPSHFTDWAYRYRLDTKIAMVMQDWGSADHPQFGALILRRDYEKFLKRRSLSREAAFRAIVQNRPPQHTSKTHNNLTSFLKNSAQKEGLSLPEDFLDHIYFTNAVLCFRRQGIGTEAAISI